jgi:hypothetical protein
LLDVHLGKEAVWKRKVVKYANFQNLTPLLAEVDKMIDMESKLIGRSEEDRFSTSTIQSFIGLRGFAFVKGELAREEEEEEEEQPSGKSIGHSFLGFHIFFFLFCDCPFHLTPSTFASSSLFSVHT